MSEKIELDNPNKVAWKFSYLKKNVRQKTIFAEMWEKLCGSIVQHKYFSRGQKKALNTNHFNDCWKDTCSLSVLKTEIHLKTKMWFDVKNGLMSTFYFKEYYAQISQKNDLYASE